jgi:integrase
VSLTDRKVASAKTRPARWDLADDDPKGLALRIHPSGEKLWTLRYTFRGRDRRMTIGSYPELSLKDARIKAREHKNEALSGRDPARRSASSAPTVGELAGMALAALPLRPSTAREWSRLVRAELVPAFGTVLAPDLTRREVRDWMDQRAAQPRGTWTANRAFEVLRRTFTWAMSRDIVEVSPCHGLQKPAPEPRSQRVLTTDELRALLAALDKLPGAYSDAVLLLLLTCARREMVLGGRRGELELGSEPTWTIPGGRDGRSKSGEPHVIPLSKEAVKVLERRLDVIGAGSYLFPPARVRRLGVAPKRAYAVWASRYTAELQTEVGIAWATEAGKPLPMRKVKRDGKEVEELDREACRLLLPRWTLHNLRHTGATRMREHLGVRVDVVSMILGHTPEGPRVTRVYDRAHLLPERRAALVALAAHYEALRTEPEAGRVLPWQGKGRA